MKQKNVILGIIILILIGGFAYWQMSSTVEEDNLVNVNQVQEQVNTGDWEEYKNELYGYSLHIPLGYQNKTVYEDSYLPLEPNMSGLNLVKEDASIRVDTELRLLFTEEGSWDDIFQQRSEKYGYPIHEINSVRFLENFDFPENGKTFSTGIGDKALLIVFRNVNQEIIDAVMSTFKFID